MANFNQKNTQRGFSLIESMIATAIFVVVVVVGTGIFLTVSRAQQKTTVTSGTQQDIRFALEGIAKEVRMGTIDSKYYFDNNIDTDKAVDQLAIITNNKRHYLFRKNNDEQIEVAINSDYYSSPANFEIMTQENTNIKDLTFFITDPGYGIGGGPFEKKQPRVTIIIQLAGEEGENPDESTTLNLQTTVASRLYE